MSPQYKTALVFMAFHISSTLHSKVICLLQESFDLQFLSNVCCGNGIVHRRNIHRIKGRPKERQKRGFIPVVKWDRQEIPDGIIPQSMLVWLLPNYSANLCELIKYNYTSNASTGVTRITEAYTPKFFKWNLYFPVIVRLKLKCLVTEKCFFLILQFCYK